MSKLPVIGISASINTEETSYSLPRSYMMAVSAGGAVPVLLPYDMSDEAVESCLDHLDGVLLSGGDDVDPALYGENQTYALGEINPIRDEFEIRLIKAACKRQMPVFGICRGIQILNAAFGGKLWQDLPSQYSGTPDQPLIRHRQASISRYLSHRVHVEEGTLLRSVVLDASFCTNSFHHQAVREAAEGFRVTAHAEDGVIEAIEHETLPFCLGVQWHPERSFSFEPNAKALFTAFAKAAMDYQQRLE